MRFRLMLACVIAAIAAPAGHTSPPVPSVEDVLRQLNRGVTAEDYCVYEVDEYGNRRKIACAPGGSLPALVIDRPAL